MRQLLETWQKKTGDPLLTGQKICLPEGAICCTTDSYSTKDPGDSSGMQKVSGRAAWSAAEQY